MVIRKFTCLVDVLSFTYLNLTCLPGTILPDAHDNQPEYRLLKKFAYETIGQYVMPLVYSSAFTVPIYNYMKQDWRNISFHKFYIQTIVVNLVEGFTNIHVRYSFLLRRAVFFLIFHFKNVMTLKSMNLSRTVFEIDGDFSRKLQIFTTPCILRPR